MLSTFVNVSETLCCNCDPFYIASPATDLGHLVNLQICSNKPSKQQYTVSVAVANHLEVSYLPLVDSKELL